MWKRSNIKWQDIQTNKPLFPIVWPSNISPYNFFGTKGNIYKSIWLFQMVASCATQVVDEYCII